VAGTTDAEDGRGGWKTALLAFGALLGLSVIWGWLRPEPEVVELDPTDLPVTAGPTTAPVAAPMGAGAPDPSTGRPAWLRPTIIWTIGLIAAVVLGLVLLGALREVVTYLVLALFFSFALEPAVNFLHGRWGWRRGAATALLLGLVFLLLVLLVLVFVPTVLKGAAAIADRLPQTAQELETWSKDHLGVDVSTSSLASGGQEASASLEASSQTPMSTLFGFAVSLVGGIFALFTVAMFIFYMVAEAPKFRRTVLSFFRPERQEELLSIWEAAIDKTGGYFYSRLLLAAINGGLFYVMLRIVGVPGAAALALFEGTVAAFIPIVGTYVAATVPLVVSFISVGAEGTVVLLIYVLIYQQVENYSISPKIQGRTMQLHPAIAFAAALAGGALGVLLWAFLALPFAATVQASASLWIEHHEVVQNELTRIEATPAPEVVESEEEPLTERGGRFLRSTRGWLPRCSDPRTG
jgi:predicted PurR-regulated permease PerM